MSDPVAALADLPEVASGVAAARAEVDALLWDRAARAKGAELSAESTLLGSWASAAFEGAEVPQASLRAGAVEDSPMGRTAARTLAMYAELPAVAGTAFVAPLQVLARLHAVVAAGFVADDELGRPRHNDDVADPLRTRLAVPAADLGARLAGVAQLLTEPTQAPALVTAALVHAELAVTQPFSWGSGLVARAMTRVVLRGTGVDPDGWVVPEAGLRMLGRPKYVAALRGYASGEPQGVSRWIVVHAEAVAAGARAATELVPEL